MVAQSCGSGKCGLEQSPPVSGEGKKILYTNIGASGVIQSQIDGSREWQQDSDSEAICYVKGHQRRAEEGRFGGVLIQVVDV